MIEPKEKYFNPFTDFGFKKLFGTEVNKDLLKDFLNELLHNEAKIIELNYLHPEILGRSEADRNAVFDIHCKTEKEEYIIVEMQRGYQKYFKDRSVYYASAPIWEQGQKGDWDFNLKAVYTVSVLDFIFNKENPNYFHSKVKLMDIEQKTVFYEKLTFIYLEMPKFNKSLDELNTHFEKWLYILKHLKDLQKLPAKLQERIFKKIFKIAEIAKMTDKEKVEYENSKKRFNDYKNTIDTAKEEGFVKGKVEGKAEGIIEGKVEGLIEGEKNKAITIAKNLKAIGTMSDEQIALATRLTIVEIKSL